MSTSSSQSSQETPNISQTIKYHNQTKHHFTKYSNGPGRLDWANQPDPFRRYLNAPLIPLQHFNSNPVSIKTSAEEQQVSLNPVSIKTIVEEQVSSNPVSIKNDDKLERLNLFTSPKYPSIFTTPQESKPVNYATISHLFYNSLALSAWKSTQYSRWSLRVNPSSGNLHPTEAYLISSPIGAISDRDFIAHYAPKEHGLEIRVEIGKGFFRVCDLNLPKGCFLVGFSSVFWRESWKYGERGLRYCNHDVGHAIGCVAMSAAELGWDVKIVDGLGFGELEGLMGLGDGSSEKIAVLNEGVVKGEFVEVEFEHPDCVLAVFPRQV